MDHLKRLYESVKEEALNDYLKFLSFPSISSDLNHVADVKACCNWLSEWLRRKGFDVEVWETEGHPAIFATCLKAGEEKPTLLLYGHYDVQPVDPLEEWASPPFTPTLNGETIVARGAQDNKGQCFYTVSALAALLKENGSLPINIKLLVEGEEEIGSPSLPAWLEKKKKALQADYVAVVDVGMKDAKTPAVTLGARGILTMDIHVRGTEGDLHSGSHGGLAYNPIHALIQILDAARDKKSGKILIPGFYDDIRPLTPSERSQVDLSAREEAPGGEKEFPPAERVGLRPTFEVNGILGGYTGSGFKTVIPAKASAKASCRLVPDQDPQKVGAAVKAFLEAKAPEGVTVKVDLHPGTGRAVRAHADSKIAQAFKQAYRELFDVEPAFLLEGGSIPITTKLAEASGGEPVFVGLGLADDRIHAPNERFSLDRFRNGFLSIARTLEILDGQTP